MSINNVLKFHAIWRWSPRKVLVIWPISNGMTLWDLRAPSANRSETLHSDHYMRQLFNASPKIRGLSPKNFLPSLKFGSILHNLWLWCEYVRNDSRYQLHIIPYWAKKKFGELWSTNQKVIDAHVDPPNWLFSRDYNSALRGCWPLTFLHTLQLPKMYFKSDMGRRAASCWALPHISS